MDYTKPVGKKGCSFLRCLGEQKDRGYNWPFDHQRHAFGKAEKIIQNEGKLALQPDFAENM